MGLLITDNDYPNYGDYLVCLLNIFNNKIRAGSKWKSRSNMSIGRVNAPFLSMKKISRNYSLNAYRFQTRLELDVFKYHKLDGL
jgi:hypothetical protein